VNIFAGSCGATKSRAASSARWTSDITSQIVLRLDGTNAAEARRIIDERASEKIISERPC